MLNILGFVALLYFGYTFHRLEEPLRAGVCVGFAIVLLFKLLTT